MRLHVLPPAAAGHARLIKHVMNYISTVAEVTSPDLGLGLYEGGVLSLQLLLVVEQAVRQVSLQNGQPLLMLCCHLQG